MRRLLRKVKGTVLLQAERFRLGKLYTRVHQEFTPAVHLGAALGWLKRAQDHGSDRGVSYGCRFGDGFLDSYPETTGYIIPTMLRLAEHLGDPDCERRAQQMGDWLIEVQMPEGAVMAGMFNPKPRPAVFNTGQVLLGWTALYEKTGEERYLEAGRNAAAWMVAMQDADGCWRRGNSPHVEAGTTLYNVRAAWGLLRLALLQGDGKWQAAALRSAEHALARQLPNGWFRDCCLEDAEKPLLHTLAYAARGLLEIGCLCGREDMVAAARRTANSLLVAMRPDGFLPGRYDQQFKGRASWCCLTGSAQVSVLLAKLQAIDGDERYARARDRLNRYLMARHDLVSEDPSIRGGLAGSWPVHGGYGRFKVLNWAVKFLIDALLESEPRPAPSTPDPDRC